MIALALVLLLGAAGEPDAIALVRTQYEKATAPEDKAYLSMALFTALERERYWKRVIAEADRLPAGLPAIGKESPAERASLARMRAFEALKRHADAIAAGEKHLATWPDGAWAAEVKGQVESIRRREEYIAEERKKDHDAEIKRRIKFMKDGPMGKPFEPYIRCEIVFENSAWERAVEECLACAKARLEKGDDFLAMNALRSVAVAYIELGKFEEARKAFDLLPPEARKKHADIIERQLADLPRE